MQEEYIKPTSQLLEQGIDHGSPSTPRGNVQLCWPRTANSFSRDMRPSQIPRQQWEGTRLILAFQ
jgi:hypothetical protein